MNTSGDSSALSNQFRYYKVDGNTITLTALARLGTNITGRRFASMIGDPNHLGGIIYSGDIGIGYSAHYCHHLCSQTRQR